MLSSPSIGTIINYYSILNLDIPVLFISNATDGAPKAKSFITHARWPGAIGPYFRKSKMTRKAASAASSKLKVDSESGDSGSEFGDSASSPSDSEEISSIASDEEERPAPKRTPKMKRVQHAEDSGDEIETKPRKRGVKKEEDVSGDEAGHEDESSTKKRDDGKKKTPQKKQVKVKKEEVDLDEDGSDGAEASHGKASKKRANDDDTADRPKPKKSKTAKESVASAQGLPTIPQTTLDFLSELSKNNNREWFHARKKEFDGIKKDFEKFAGYVLQAVRNQFDPTILDVEGKDAVYRIHRDVRFGGLPYKPLLSFSFSRRGRKSEDKAAVFYVHIQPGGKSFVGGGMWMPPGPVIGKIREQIDQETDEGKILRRLVTKYEPFKECFGNSLLDSGDSEAPDIATSYRKSLKTAPKGYPKDHKHIELLKLKSWTVSHPVTDEEVLDEDFANEVVRICGEMAPFIRALNDVIDT